MVCKSCGEELMKGATSCPKCGTEVFRSPYNRDTVILLSCLGAFGIAGAHRLYTGRIGSGILWLLTGGLCGLGTVYDIYKIFTNQFVDSEDRPVLP